MGSTNGQDEIRSMEEEIRRHVNRPRLILLLIALALIIGGIVFFVLRRNRPFSSADLAATYELSAGGSAEAVPFSSQMLRYSQDGASLVSAAGRELWNVTYSMNAPRAVIRENYAAVYDAGGTRAVILDKDGFVGEYATTDPILTLALSNTGVTAVALDRDLNTLICFYSKSTRLDIEISLEMSISGYPLAMALSSDGNGLVVSTVSSTIGAVKDQMVFYNFSLGKTESNRLIGYYTYEGHLFPQVDYLTARRVAAAGDDRIVFFSLEQENKPQELKTVFLSGEMTAYTVGNGHVALIEPDQRTGEQMLSVYDADGDLCFSQSFSGSCRSLTLDERYVILLTDSGLTLWNYTGNKRFSGALSEGGLVFMTTGSRRIVQFDGSYIHQYRLK